MRFLSIITLVAFISTVIGCTKIARVPVHEAAERPDKKIYAVGLHSSHPYDIELKDIDRIDVIRILHAEEGASIRETVSPKSFRDEASRFVTMKVARVVMKSGETINLEDRGSYYESWEDAIKVTGSEIMFDSAGAFFDADENTILGRTLEGDVASLSLEDVAYIRQKRTDVGATILTIAGVTAGVSLIVGLIIAGFYANMD